MHAMACQVGMASLHVKAPAHFEQLKPDERFRIRARWPFMGTPGELTPAARDGIQVHARLKTGIFTREPDMPGHRLEASGQL